MSEGKFHNCPLLLSKSKIEIKCTKSWDVTDIHPTTWDRCLFFSLFFLKECKILLLWFDFCDDNENNNNSNATSDHADPASVAGVINKYRWHVFFCFFSADRSTSLRPYRVLGRTAEAGIIWGPPPLPSPSSLLPSVTSSKGFQWKCKNPFIIKWKGPEQRSGLWFIHVFQNSEDTFLRAWKHKKQFLNCIHKNLWLFWQNQTKKPESSFICSRDD